MGAIREFSDVIVLTRMTIGQLKMVEHYLIPEGIDHDLELAEAILKDAKNRLGLMAVLGHVEAIPKLAHLGKEIARLEELIKKGRVPA